MEPKQFFLKKLRPGLKSREILVYCFHVSLVSYLAFYLLDFLYSGFVTLFFNLDIILWITVVFAVFTAIWPVNELNIEKPKKIPWQSGLGIFTFALCVALIFWNKTHTFGSFSKILALLSGLVFFGLVVVLYIERQKN